MHWVLHQLVQLLNFLKAKDMIFLRNMDHLLQLLPVHLVVLCYMLAEYGTMSLKQVLAPAMQLAAGYPIEDETANSIERNKERIKEWPY